MTTSKVNLCENPPKKYGPKSTMAQLYATVAQSFLFIGLGMNLTIPAIVIRDLYTNGSSRQFSLTINEASWYGSLVYLINPIGCLSSGFVQEKYGIKSCMIFANIPSIIGWIMLYSTYSSSLLCASTVLMGFSAGFGASSTASYVGQITEPRLRGLFGSVGSTAMRIGTLSIYMLGYFFDWRTVSLISTIGPIICWCLILFVPESPIWLIAKGKHAKAEKSLCWLRGWVQPEAVKVEFLELIHYNNVSGTLAGEVGIEDDRLISKLSKFKNPAVYRPFRLLMILFFVSFIAGLTPAKPFVCNILTEVGLTEHQSLYLIFFAVQQNVGSLMLLLTVRRLGKRFLTLFTLSLNSTLLLVFGIYISAMKYNLISSYPCIPLILLNIIYFSGGFGLTCIPWTFLNEVFPNKSRGIATSLCTALAYIILFMLTKIYLTVEMFLSLEYTMLLFGGIGFIGLVYFLFYLPETEKKTLLEIEEFFASNSKAF